MCVFRSPAALPPPEPLCFERSVTLYPQQTSSLRSTLDALHRQVAQILPRLLALTSPLAPRSQQLSPSHRSHTFRRPLSLAFAPHLRRTHDQHTLASTRTQGCGGSAGVAGVRDRGRWEVLGRGHAHHLITPRLYHHFNSTRHHATISGMASARVRAPRDGIHPYPKPPPPSPFRARAEGASREGGYNISQGSNPGAGLVIPGM